MIKIGIPLGPPHRDMPVLEGAELWPPPPPMRPLTVSTDGTTGPYVVVIPQQLGPVIDAMRTEGIRFRVDQDAVMLDGDPRLP